MGYARPELSIIVTVLELVGRAPAQGWGGDTARPRDRAASFITAYCPVPLTVRGIHNSIPSSKPNRLGQLPTTQPCVRVPP